MQEDLPSLSPADGLGDELASFIARPEVVWWLIGITGFLLIIISAVFLYHWTTYGFGSRKLQRMKMLYFSGAIVLFGIVVVSAYLYTTSL